MLIVAQVIISLILIVLILLQERSSGLSGVLGGTGATPYQTRRGLEKVIFTATVASAALFAILAVINLIA